MSVRQRARGPGTMNPNRPNGCGFSPILLSGTSFAPGPEDLRMITVDGDSMEPLLSSGDRILIDVSQRVRRRRASS